MTWAGEKEFGSLERVATAVRSFLADKKYQDSARAAIDTAQSVLKLRLEGHTYSDNRIDSEQMIKDLKAVAYATVDSRMPGYEAKKVETAIDNLISRAIEKNGTNYKHIGLEVLDVVDQAKTKGIASLEASISPREIAASKILRGHAAEIRSMVENAIQEALIQTDTSNPDRPEGTEGVKGIKRSLCVWFRAQWQPGFWHHSS